MTTDEIIQELDNIMKKIEKNKKYWRFNYSLGLSNGCVYGSSYSDEEKKQ